MASSCSALSTSRLSVYVVMHNDAYFSRFSDITSASSASSLFTVFSTTMKMRISGAPSTMISSRCAREMLFRYVSESATLPKGAE